MPLAPFANLSMENSKVLYHFVPLKMVKALNHKHNLNVLPFNNSSGFQTTLFHMYCGLFRAIITSVQISDCLGSHSKIRHSAMLPKLNFTCCIYRTVASKC
uniref:Uncharacterized protein n=1 Tax=Micrurus carvalhoi TaxID=3147026 RepID=A0A2H6N5D6_9SAUR